MHLEADDAVVAGAAKAITRVWASLQPLAPEMATGALPPLRTQTMSTTVLHKTTAEAQGLIEDFAWEPTVRGITIDGRNKK